MTENERINRKAILDRLTPSLNGRVTLEQEVYSDAINNTFWVGVIVGVIFTSIISIIIINI